MKRTDYYDLLGLDKDCTDSDIKKAYRKLALIWHPDKNQNDVEKATQHFSEIKEAYETLSDPQERAWYDSHKEQILSGDAFGAEFGSESSDYIGTTTEVVMMHFNINCFYEFDDNPKGFYTVYRELFSKLRDEELWSLDNTNLHLAETLYNLDFGMQKTLYDPEIQKSVGEYQETQQGSTLRDFYNFWLAFNTNKSFVWKEKYRLPDAINRQVRRLMEKENNVLKERAKREYSEAVQNLAAWLKKRDPRVAAFNKFSEELTKKKEAEMKKRVAAERTNLLKKASEFERQSWQHVDYTAMLDEHLPEYSSAKFFKSKKDGGAVFSDEELDAEHELINSFNDEGWVVDPETGEFVQVSSNDAAVGSTPEPSSLPHCEICNKSFKSALQLENHTKSKKHIKAARDFARNSGIRVGKTKNNHRATPDQAEDMGDTNVSADGVSEDEFFDAVDNHVEERLESLSLDKKSDKKKSKKQKKPLFSFDYQHLHSSGEDETTYIPKDQCPDSHADNKRSSIAKNAKEEQKNVSSEIPNSTHKEDISPLDDLHQQQPQQDGNDGNDGTMDADDALTKAKAKKKQKAKLKQSTDTITCNVCSRVFDSRNQLFSHIKDTGHALASSNIPKHLIKEMLDFRTNSKSSKSKKRK